MTQRLKIWLLCTLYLLLGTAQSQTFPCNAQLSVAPPYSLFLTDYSVGSNIMLNLIQRDVTQNGGEAYLNIELEGGGIRLKTLPTFRPSTYVDIVPGVMHMLSNSDLAEYFNINSLSFEGISREAFMANGYQLPEGLYKFKVKAFFKFTGTQASNEALTIMGLQRGQSPIINQPIEKGKVSENPMQNFNINWTARSINPSNMPSYRLQMWEMLDPSQDPNIIVNSNYPPILDEFTNFTTFQYGMSQTPLTAGKSYVIRVQVLDPEGRDVYANSGYSQVRRFTYGDPCDPPTNLTATLDNRGIQANWALTPNQGGYRFQHGRIDTAWTDVDVFINRFSIEKIYPSAQYQIRVSTLCGNGKQSEYSDIVYIGTPPTGSKNNSACGDPFPKIEFKSKRLLPSLAVGDKFTSFDFDVTVTRVTRNDSNSYAGEGKTPFNMLGGVDVVCYFDGIQINTDRQHINDVPVRFQQKPYVFSDKNVKQFKEDYKDTQEMLSQNDAATPTSVNIDVTIGTVTYDSTKKEIVVNDAQGNTVKTLSSGKDYKITDKDGNVYLVSKDNKVTKQPKATESTVKGGAPVKEGGENYDIHFTENQPILTFEAHPQQTWGFDAEPMNSMVKTFYESIINTQRAYYVPYKSIGSAGTDKVIAKVERNPEDVDLKRIKFKTNAGVAVPFDYDAVKEEWTLTITAGLHRNDFSVFPYYGNGKDTLCGKLNVMPLDKKEVNLILVPLNGFKTSNVKATDIEAYLNTVYKQTNIAYKVSLDYAFSSASADLPLSVEHGKLEGEYSANQANVITDYQVQHPEQDNTIYLFLCKEGSNDAVKGHTPVNRSYGFIFGENIDRRTIAHEVGHGYPLAMEHPFTTGGATGTFSNLMDYASGTNLTFMQWGKAHNPKLKVRFGQSSSQGLALQDDGLFLAPDGTVFEIPKLVDNSTYRYWVTELIPNGPILKLTRQINLDNGIDPNSVYEFDKTASAFVNKSTGDRLNTVQIKSFSERFPTLGYNATISSYCENINVVSGTLDKPVIVNHRLLVFGTEKEYNSFEKDHAGDVLGSSYDQSKVSSCIKKAYRTSTTANYELKGDASFKLFALTNGCSVISSLLTVKNGFSITGQYQGAFPIWGTKTGNKAPPTTPNLATTSDQIKAKYKDVSNSKIAGSKVSILENGILLTIDAKGNKTIENDPAKIQALKTNIQSGNITDNSQVLVESKMVDGKVVHDITFGLKSGVTPQKAGFKPLTETERQSLQTEVKKKMEDFLRKSSSDNLATIQPKTTDPNAFETDGSKTVVKEASIIEMISGVTKTAGELLEKCAIPASVYDSKDAGYQKSIFNTSPFACGLGNGMVDELKSIPQLVLLATDIALKEEVRDALVTQFKALTPSKVGSALVGFGKQTLGTIAGSSDKDYHDKGKMTFELATLIFGGVAGKADDALKTSDDAVTSFGTIASKIDDAAGSPYKIFIAQTKNLRKLFAQLNPSQIKADDLNKFVDKLNALPQGQARKDLFEALDASDVKLDELDRYIKAVEADPSKLSKEKWEEFRKEKNVDVLDDLNSFVNKSLNDKLKHIDDVWKTKYPVQEMLDGRSFFEDVMGQYRYTKGSGWSHTGDIAPNFKGVDFYKGTEVGNQIFVETAVSMKTTITTNVDNWLASAPIKKNIEFLKEGLNPTKGLQSNSKTMMIQNAEIHIYMPKKNISDELKNAWLDKLSLVNPKIRFEIKALEDFIN